MSSYRSCPNCGRIYYSVAGEAQFDFCSCDCHMNFMMEENKRRIKEYNIRQEKEKFTRFQIMDIE